MKPTTTMIRRPTTRNASRGTGREALRWATAPRILKPFAEPCLGRKGTATFKHRPIKA